MTWTPLEVIMILFVWFPIALPLILTPYILTILSVNALAAGSFAAVQGATESSARGWFGLLSGIFLFVLVGGVILLMLTASA